MRKNKRLRGMGFLGIGILLLLSAGGWYISNVLEDKKAGAYVDTVISKMDEEVFKENTSNTDDIPTIAVDGELYCGRVVIEKLSIELPVFEAWNYKKLKKAPCRYVGNIDTNDMIIAAHNYRSHFGELKSLQIGDMIDFWDAEGEVHQFTVKEMVLLDGSAVEDMTSGEWDFTLFTCTKGGKQRVTVRCERVNKE